MNGKEKSIWRGLIYEREKAEYYLSWDKYYEVHQSLQRMKLLLKEIDEIKAPKK